MRDTKFRAWDEMNKVMHYNFKFINSGDSGNDWVIFISDKFTLENHETNPFKNPSPYFSQQFKKMQYTGLKDKKGVKIYEGDIVKLKYVSHPQQISYSTVLASFIIGNEYMFTVVQDIEVIGNIYENPELLKKV